MSDSTYKPNTSPSRPNAQAQPFRPSPARSATLGATPSVQNKSRAASQPPGERLPAPGSNPDSGRGSPAGMFGVIGGSRTPSRFGNIGGGTATRASSFSAGEYRDPRNPTLTRTLSSHMEELPSRSRSTSPFPPAFSSPSSSPATSPQSSKPIALHSSPPKPYASRSRSQSLAVGVRPGVDRGFGHPMSTLENTGAFPRSFDAGWVDPSGGSNMSPFTRNMPTFRPQYDNTRFRSPIEATYPSRGLAYTGWGSSAPATALASSVARAFGEVQHNQPAFSTVIGGFREPVTNGNRSGSSSRRHSVSVVGGPGGRRDLFSEGLGMGMTSPPGRGLGPLGFTDAELLPEKLGNALSLEIDESRRRGVEIEVGRGKDVSVSSQARSQTVIDSPTDSRTRSRFFDNGDSSRIGQSGPGPIGPPASLMPYNSQGYARPPPFGPSSPSQLTGGTSYGRPPYPYQNGPRPPYGAYPPNQAPPPANMQPQYGGQYQSQGSPPQPTSPSFSTLSLSDLGRGIPLNGLPPNTPLYIVTFKAGRRDVFYCPDPTLLISNGDRVIVEADRGSDLGTVVYDQLTPVDVRDWQEKQATAALMSGAREHQPPGLAVAGVMNVSKHARVTIGELAGADLSTLLAGVGGGQSDNPMATTSQARGPLAKEIMPKRIFAKSSQGPEEQARMMEKMRDEHDAMLICREKAAQRGMPMQIVDAEYQWDRRKLTFYFKADKRIDFRELTKENFRIFKSRIWMAMVPKDDPRTG